MRTIPYLGMIILGALPLAAGAAGSQATGANEPAEPPSQQAPTKSGVTVLKDIEYVPGGGPLRSLDLYLPPPSGQPSPLVVFIHGGGWHSGSKDGCPAQFLAGQGYVVASINYRLVPDAVFPAQIEDCRAALRFLRAQAAKYSIQPDRVGVWGGSAGGHLASLLGTAATADFSTVPATIADKGSPDESIRVQCVIDLYGPADFTLSREDRPKQKAGPALLGPTTSAEELLAKKKWASPVTYVQPGNPPFLIQHGDADKTVLLQQSQGFYNALKAAGVDATLMVMPGEVHAGAAFFTKENQRVLAAFLDKHLKPAK